MPPTATFTISDTLTQRLVATAQDEYKKSHGIILYTICMFIQADSTNNLQSLLKRSQ